MDDFEKVAKENKGLIWKVLNRSGALKMFTDEKEAFQVGLIGLWMAWKNYDKNKGAFSTYAWLCIYREIHDSIGFDLGLTRSQHRTFKNQNHELAAPCFVSLKFIQEARTENFFEQYEIRNFLDKKLKREEVHILIMRHKGLTFSEIGKNQGYSLARANQVYTRIMNKLKKESKWLQQD